MQRRSRWGRIGQKNRALFAPRKRRISKRYKSTAPAGLSFDGNVIIFKIPRKIKSGNKLKSGFARHGDTKAWEKDFQQTLAATTLDATSVQPICSPERMRLEVVRQAPRPQFFLDKTNLHIGIKGLEDALVRLGYLYDDREEWLDGPYCSNEVSDDGKFWAVIRISKASYVNKIPTAA